MKPCQICQTLFTPRRHTDLTCGNPVCRRKRDAANARAKRLAEKPTVKCRFCGAEFTPNAPTRCSGVCRSENCQIRLKRENESKRQRKAAQAQPVPGRAQQEKAAPVKVNNFVKRQAKKTKKQTDEETAINNAVIKAYYRKLARGDHYDAQSIRANSPELFGGVG